MKYNAGQAGSNAHASTELYLAYCQRINQYMRYRCPSKQTTEDLTITVFERILRNLQRYKHENVPLDAWVFTIAANCFRDWFGCGHIDIGIIMEPGWQSDCNGGYLRPARPPFRYRCGQR